MTVPVLWFIALAFSGFQAYRSGSNPGYRTVLLALICFPCFMAVLPAALATASRLAPEKRDLYLYGAENALGFQASFILGRFALKVPAFLRVETAIYASIEAPALLVLCAHFLTPKKWPVMVVRAVTLNFLAGFCLYFLFPAAGPLFAFGFPTYPRNPPPLSSLHFGVLPIAAPPNAMPSVHASTALLIWWNAWPWRWLRHGALVFYLLTLIATLTTGEHYLLDLIVAVPFTLAVQAAASRVAGRLRSFLIGASLTLVWIATLRLHPEWLIGRFYVVWPLVLLTLFASVREIRKLLNRIYAPGLPPAPTANTVVSAEKVRANLAMPTEPC